MYLPNDIGAVFTVVIKELRKQREFWKSLDKQDKVTRNAILRLDGQIWMLNDLMQGVMFV